MLAVAATGDHVAVTEPWGESARPLFVSVDAGENWNSALLDSADGNGRKLAVLSDDRLLLVQSVDFQAIGLRVSGTPSDWSQLEDSGHSGYLAGIFSALDVYQHGLVVNYDMSGDVEPSVSFSTDLTDWWTIPDSTSASTSNVDGWTRRSSHAAELRPPIRTSRRTQCSSQDVPSRLDVLRSALGYRRTSRGPSASVLRDGDQGALDHRHAAVG